MPDKLTGTKGMVGDMITPLNAPKPSGAPAESPAPGGVPPLKPSDPLNIVPSGGGKK